MPVRTTRYGGAAFFTGERLWIAGGPGVDGASGGSAPAPTRLPAASTLNACAVSGPSARREALRTRFCVPVSSGLLCEGGSRSGRPGSGPRRIRAGAARHQPVRPPQAAHTSARCAEARKQVASRVMVQASVAPEGGHASGPPPVYALDHPNHPGSRGALPDLPERSPAGPLFCPNPARASKRRARRAAPRRARVRPCPECGTPAGRRPAARPRPRRPPRPRKRPSRNGASSPSSSPTSSASRRLQDRDPEETRELLTRYFELARERIERYGGTIEKFIGDAVIALWGAPRPTRTTPSAPCAQPSTSSRRCLSRHHAAPRAGARRRADR